MATSENVGTRPRVYILKGEQFQSIALDMPPTILKQIPWVISVKETFFGALEALGSVPLGTLFVINEERKMVGLITNSQEVAQGCAKKKGGGGGKGGGVKPPKGGEAGCAALCAEKCATRGGCGAVIYDPFASPMYKCAYMCNDSFPDAGGTDKPLEDLFI